VVANLNPSQEAPNVRLKFSEEAMRLLKLPPDVTLTGSDLLSAKPSAISAKAKDLTTAGVTLPKLPPLSIAYFDLTTR
jgi:hypothetical protein